MTVYLSLQGPDWYDGTRKLFDCRKRFKRAPPHMLISKSLPTCKQRNPQYLTCPKKQQVTQKWFLEKRKDSTVKLNEDVIIPVSFV